MAEENEQNLLAGYFTLPPLEQALLLLVSVIYEPVATPFLLPCMAKADFGALGTFRPTREVLESALDRLREKKFLNEKNCIPQPLVEYITRQAVRSGIFPQLTALVEKVAPVSYQAGKWSTRCRRAMRQFRIGIYHGDFVKIDEAMAFLDEYCRHRFAGKPPAVMVAAEAFDPLWFGALPGSLQFYLLEQVLRYSMDQLQHYPPVLSYLADESALTISPDEQVPFHRLLAGYYLLEGRFTELQTLLAKHPDSFRGSGFSGTLAFLRGDTEQAHLLFTEDLRQLHVFFGDRSAFFFGLPGLFCVFALLDRNLIEDRLLIKQYIAIALARYQECPEEVPYLFIDALVSSMDSSLPDMKALTERLQADEGSLTRFIAVLCLCWMGVEIPEEFKSSLALVYERAAGNGFAWLAMEAAFLLGELELERSEERRVGKECRSRWSPYH